MKYVLTEVYCIHWKDKNRQCDENYCYMNELTELDYLLINISFNIFILFCYLRDIFPDNREKLMVFYFDEKRDLASAFDSDINSKAEIKEQKRIFSKDDEDLKLRQARTMSKQTLHRRSSHDILNNKEVAYPNNHDALAFDPFDD